MRYFIFFIFISNYFLTNAQFVTIKEYYAGVPGAVVSGDTIDLSAMGSNITIPILVEIDSDTAVDVKYNLIKIDDDTCVDGILNVVFEPDNLVQNSCFSTNAQNPNSLTYSVENPNATILTLITSFTFNCLGCLHYRYTVSVDGVLQDSVDFNICNTLEVLPFEKQEQSYFPNPFSDHVSFVLTDLVGKLSIFDTHGKLIQSSMVQNGELVSMKNLETGVYFFEVTTEKGTQVKRMIKN